MKTWVNHQTRDGHAVLPGGMDQELSALRASFGGLDRTQLPADSFDEVEFSLYAKHRVWTAFKTQQDNVLDTTIDGDNSWVSFTGENSPVGPMLFQQTTLTGHKGGNILVNWSANVLVSQWMSYTVNQTSARNPNHIGLKIVIGGLTVAERIGPCQPHDSFQLTGSAQVPAGDPVCSLYWSVTPNGPDDIFEDVTNNAHLMRAHLFGSKFFAIGRFR
jgi:hypothetical protein